MPSYRSNIAESSYGVFQDGDYPFTVVDAEEKRSQSGNDMIQTQLLVTNGSGQQITVWDHLVFAEKSTWKIDRFRAATGDPVIPGEEVTLEAQDCIRRRGRCTLEIEVYKNKARNKVADYVVPEKDVQQPDKKLKLRQPTNPDTPVSKNPDVEPDEIPF